MTKKTAFVAMAFASPADKDRKYRAIRRVLSEAGFAVTRSDEIRSSGPVNDEVCRLLKEADLVVIDSSGDSHSVSYEIGYCHGVNRPANKTVLLRDNSSIPFSYRHYRHVLYSDLKVLQQVLRAAIGISKPLRDEDLGYAVVFELAENAVVSERLVFDSLWDTIFDYRLTGRVEVHLDMGSPHIEELTGLGILRVRIRPFPSPGDPRLLRVGIGIVQPPPGRLPDYYWWEKFADQFAHKLISVQAGVRLAEGLSEMAVMRNIRSDVRRRVAADFSNGKPVRVLHQDGEELDSSDLAVKTLEDRLN
jgi:hypothetical protein